MLLPIMKVLFARGEAKSWIQTYGTMRIQEKETIPNFRQGGEERSASGMDLKKATL